MNNQSDFLKEICEEKGIQLECLSFGYVMRLAKNENSQHIFGPYWDINSAAADRIACDKTACSLLLSRSGIPAIPHEILCNPLRKAGFAGKDGVWLRAVNFLREHKRVVLKPNQGTKGQDIFLCETPVQLETAVSAIFQNYPDAAISPYHEIETEYRVFFVNGNCRLVYGKKKGITWQHNLSQGATAFELSENNEKIPSLKNLATRAANCINIAFATIDIAESPRGELLVMEINSGVQALQLLEQLPHLRPVIKNIYTEAVELFQKLFP